MKRIIWVLLLLISLNVKADETCDRAELNRLKEVAKKITYAYEFNEQLDENGNPVGGTFDIILDNVSEEVKPMIIYSWIGMSFDVFERDQDGTATSKSFRPGGYPPGESIRITIKAYVDNGCIANDLIIKTIKLPYFNDFLDSDECKTYPEFKLCKDKLTNSKITDRQFKIEFDKYLENLEKNPPVLKVDNTILYIALGAIIFIPLAIYVILFIKQIHKKREELDI